jgi:hypothetical protein
MEGRQCRSFTDGGISPIETELKAASLYVFSGQDHFDFFSTTLRHRSMPFSDSLIVSSCA